MYRAAFKRRLNQIYLGALIWGVFYLVVFHDSSRWSETVVGNLMNDESMLKNGLLFQAVFFMVLSIQLYTVVIGKKNSVFDIVKFFDVLVMTSIFVLLVYTVVRLFGLPFHVGVLRIVSEWHVSGSSGDLMAEESLSYVLASMMLLVYLTGVLIFLYQMKRMSVSTSFMDNLRIGLTFVLYGAVLLYQYQALVETDLIVGHRGLFPNGAFELGPMLVMFLVLNVLYVWFGFFVYVKSRYSFRAVFVAIALLFLI